MALLTRIVLRSKGDFRLAAVLAGAALMTLSLVPFAIYRAALGQWEAAAIDLGIGLVVVVIAGLGWRRHDTRFAGPAMAGFASLTCVGIGYVIGLTAVFWTAPVILGNYLLSPRRLAGAYSLGMIAGQVLLHHDLLAGATGGPTFVVTSLLVMVCAHVASSLGESQRAGLETLATRDPLTGLGNRRAMELCLENTTAADSDAVIAVVDMDHFKRVNDRHGHEAGDDVLRQFAQLARTRVRRSDRIFRMGGEEFVLVLPDSDEAGGRQALEKLLAGVRSELKCPGGPVTVSIGACTRVPGSTWSAWMAAADDALYRVKRAGRDGLAFAVPEARDGVPPDRL